MNAPRLARASVFALALASSALAATSGSATPEQKLAELKLTLPATSAPVANYVPAVRSGNLVYLAGHIPFDAAGKVIAGQVGRNATDKEANAAARQCALGLLASLKREIGDLAKVKRVVKVAGFVNAAPEFQGHSQVINGASDLLVAVFGERGKHARASLGMSSLPLGALVEVEMIVEIE
jgi:enamine deaminase RidA (YjgF/YER057c/UK114 family)